jgi:hypothetical protein
VRPRSHSDVLRELENLRRDTLRRVTTPPAAVADAGDNGQRELARDIQLTLKRADFKRARRFSLSLLVEDADQRVVDGIRDLEVDIEDVAQLDKILLHLNIALRAKE